MSNRFESLDLESRLPEAVREVYDVSFLIADTDKVVPHTLRPNASHEVRYQVVDSNTPGMIYRGSRAAGDDFIVLRASAIGTYRIRFFLEAKVGITNPLPKLVWAGGALTPPWSKSQQHAQTAYRDAGNVFSVAGNEFQEILLVDKGLKFPATEVTSADVNTLTDYERGPWTPVLTFVTPGNLSVAYTDQDGRYTKIGDVVIATFRITTSTFTHTTASGNLQVTGLPFAANAASPISRGAFIFGGITKAGYTSFVTTINVSTSIVEFRASGSGVALAIVDAADLPTGGTVILASTIVYNV